VGFDLAVLRARALRAPNLFRFVNTPNGALPPPPPPPDFLILLNKSFLLLSVCVLTDTVLWPLLILNMNEIAKRHVQYMYSSPEIEIYVPCHINPCCTLLYSTVVTALERPQPTLGA
jgi:hypothetical protein